MTVSRARTIDDLYDAVADYDLVLTADAPLSLALNRRLEEPRLGRFAATPRMLASGQFRPHDRRTLFLELVDRTDLDWKQIDYLVGTLLGCWEETGDRRAILEYDRFDTPAMRTALEVVEQIGSAHGDIASVTIPTDQDVAVIAPDHLSTLDRQVLPEDFDTIDPFIDESIDLPPFRIFESTTAIVDTVLENVTADTAEDIAIIMDPTSEYPTLVESALAAHDIPFHGGPGFADDEVVRAVLRLLRVATGPDDVRLSAVRPLLQVLGEEVPIADDDRRLFALDHDVLAPIQTLCREIEGQSFDDVIATVEEWSDHELHAFRAELERLGILEESASRSRLEDLLFYLDAVDVPVDRDDSGVLLADPSAAGTVDRPIVFFLGMGTGWTQDIPKRPWIDREHTDRIHREQFELLLQSGVEQYILVRETVAGTPVTPCWYLHELLEGPLETFADADHVRYTSYTTDAAQEFDHEPVDSEPQPIQTISQSRLNTFVNSPRDYAFDQLVEGPDRDYFTKGTLLHDYAEFAVNHPSFVDGLETESVVDLMLEELAPLVDERQIEPLETELTLGVELIREFLEASPPVENSYETYEVRPFGSNTFADHFDREITSPITEQWFESVDLGAKGLVDLIHEPTRLIDYKTGNSSTERSVIRNSRLDPIADEPDFQALLYLAHHRREIPDEQLEFTFFHVLDLVDEALSGDHTLEDAMVRIQYHPVPFSEFVGSREAFEMCCSGVVESNKRRKTLERLGYDRYEQIFDQYEFPMTESKAALLESDFADSFTTVVIQSLEDQKQYRQGVEKTLKKLYSIGQQRYFADDLDAFEDFLENQLELMNAYRDTRFPAGDPNEDRLNNRDMLLSDD